MFNRAEKLDNARAERDKDSCRGGRRKEEEKRRVRERERAQKEGQRVFNPPTVLESGTESIYWPASLRDAAVYVQLVATTAEDAKTDLPESSLTKFA